MDLVEVNSFDPQPAQTVFALASNGVCLQHVVNLPMFIPTQSAFGENIRPLARPRFQRPGDNFLRVAHAVNRGGINPVDAQFERAMDGGDGRFVVLLAPGEFPACTADGPCAEAHGGDEQVRIAESFRFHRSSCVCVHSVVIVSLFPASRPRAI